MDKHSSMERLGVPRYSYYLHDDSCWNRIPYCSSIAFCMCFVGVVLFASMMWFSVNASVEQVRRALELNDIPWLDKIYLFFTIIAVIMIFFAIFLLITAILSTGTTREQIYKRESARKGGECFGITAMACSYVLIIVWMVVTALTGVLSATYFILSRLCSSLTTYNDASCLDFSVFQPLVKDLSGKNLILCGGNAQQFCAATYGVVFWYLIGFLGALMVTLGLVQFLASSTANHSRVKNEKRYSELHNAVFGDTGMDYTIYPQTKYYPATQNPTLASYHCGTEPRAYNKQPGAVPQRFQNNTLPYPPYSRRNSYHTGMHEGPGWMSHDY